MQRKIVYLSLGDTEDNQVKITINGTEEKVQHLIRLLETHYSFQYFANLPEEEK